MARIAQFIDSMDPGGAEDTVLELSRRLSESGRDVTILHFGNPFIAERSLEWDIPQIVLEDHALYKSKRTLALFLWRFRRFLRQQQFDLLHSHLLGAVFAGAMSARLAGLPSVGTLHDTYTLSENANARLMLSLCIAARCHLVAVSSDMRRVISQWIKEQDIDLIYNGVDLARFSVADSRDDAEAPVVITAVARFVEVKRLDILLRAVNEIRTSANWQVRLVGEGPMEQNLKALADKLGLADRVVFTGFRNDIPEQLASSDIYALTSDSEGLSVSIIESMASGLPAVATNVGGNSELIEDGVSGYLVPRGDSRALAEKLTLLIDDEGLRRRLAAAARQRAVQHFSAGVTAGNYADLYQSSLGLSIPCAI